jgi:cytochrome c biogenesis protein
LGSVVLVDKKNPVWSFFSSVKLAITLLIIIAIASILGTIIPQQEAAGTFVSRLSPGMVSVLHKLQLFDIFHSIWFLSLLFLLSVNLIVCSLHRFPISWKRFRTISAPDEGDIFRDLHANRVILTEENLEGETERIESLLKKRFKRVARKDTGDASFLIGEKGNFSYFAVYLIHVSVLIIMAGVIIGFLLGFEAYVELAEGESVDTVQLKGGKGLKKLDFTVRCDRFTIDYYKDGTPKLYQSDLAFVKNDSILHQSPVLVNHPISFAGIRFYQANYGKIPSGEAVIMLRKGREKAQVINVGMGKEFDLPGGEGKATVIRMEENLMRMGPAVKINIATAKGNVQFWVFQNIEKIAEENPGLLDHVPMFNPGAFTPYVFSLAMMNTKYFTGLQVARDPGVPVVIAGSLLIVLGFITVFFYAHRQVWIRIDRKGQHTRVSVTGKTNKDPVGLDREIHRIMSVLDKAEVKGA